MVPVVDDEPVPCDPDDADDEYEFLGCLGLSIAHIKEKIQ